jgi:hypothetical protein
MTRIPFADPVPGDQAKPSTTAAYRPETLSTEPPREAAGNNAECDLDAEAGLSSART